MCEIGQNVENFEKKKKKKKKRARKRKISPRELVEIDQ